MAASVRIEDEAFADVRYDVLAMVCQLADADHARGKMAKLWRQCTQQQVRILPVSVVVSVLGPNAVEALQKASLGEEVDGGIRIRGTRGRIEWLGKLRKNAQKGGRAKAAKRHSGGTAEEPKTLPPPFPPAPAPAPAPALVLVPEPRTKSPAATVAAEVVEAFNQTFRRNLSPDGFAMGVKRVMGKGYTPDQIRGVVWWAGREWGDDEERRKTLTPTTLLKLSSSQGYRTFPEYLSCAGERWRDEHNGETPPWEVGELEEVSQ